MQDFNLRGKRGAPEDKLRRLCGTVPAGQAQRPRGKDDVDAMTKHSNQHDKERSTGLTGWRPLSVFLRKGYSKLPPASYQPLAVRVTNIT